MKKINYFRIFLVLLLLVSLFFYWKIYIRKDEKISDLPENITAYTWYNNSSTIRFASGKFKYVDKDEKDKINLSSCKEYSYDEDSTKITFDCDDYTMNIKSVSKYKMEVTLNDKDKNIDYTYYNSKDLVNYINKNNIKDVTDEVIEEIMRKNDFKELDINNNDKYKEVQLSKLSSIDELSIDEFANLKKSTKKAIILLINPNMDMLSYDLIPVFISWKDQYSDYKFYYINGNNVKVNDDILLSENEKLEEYLTGLHNASLLVLDNDEYQRFDMEIIKENSEGIFDCLGEECKNITMRIYDESSNYNSLEEIINKEEV